MLKLHQINNTELSSKELCHLKGQLQKNEEVQFISYGELSHPHKRTSALR